MRNQYTHTKIKRIIEHSENMRSFVLDTSFSSTPGQFVMVWLPKYDKPYTFLDSDGDEVEETSNEKPVSLSNSDMISVKKVGPFTEEMFKKKTGDCLDIRGPYGNGFPISRKNTVIGGGCGIAPIMYLIRRDAATGVVLAGKTKSDLIFLEDILENFHNCLDSVVCVTEDGSYGVKGLATDVDIPKAEHQYHICGPEIMMAKVAEKLINQNINPSWIHLSMERYMKCAVGVCRSCSISGYSVCGDGPVFRYDKIKDLPHFNKYGRTRTGELVEK